MADAPEVQIKITALEEGVAATFRELIAQLQHLKEKEKETAESSLDLKEAFTGLLEVLAVEKLVEFGKEVFEAGIKIARMAQLTGISAETISVYTQATQDAGGSVDDMQAGLSKLALTLTQAEQGNAKAAKAIALVGLTMKDFVGLNADQKLKKITEAIGAMPPGFQQLAAAQKLLGEGAQKLLPALKSLAGEGFAHAAEEAEKFGNVLTTQAARDLLEAQAAIKDLEAAAEGAARQFETGIIPSLTKVAEAITEATSGKNADGFKTLGEEAGVAIRSIVFAVLSIGTSAGVAAAEVEEVFTYAFEHTKSFAKETFAAIGGYITGGVLGAERAMSERLAKSGDKDLQEFGARIAAMEKTATDAQQKIYDSLFPTETKKPPAVVPPGADPTLVNEAAEKASLKKQQQDEELFRLTIAGQNRQLTEELAIGKAFAAAKEAQDLSAFDRGLVTLKTYYDDRRAALEAEGRAEITALTEQRANELRVEELAAKNAAAFRAQARKVGVDSTVGAEYTGAAAKEDQERARSHQAVAALDAKLQEQTQKNLAALTHQDLARYKAEEEQLKKLAGFHKTMLELQGKTAEAAQVEVDAKEAEFRVLLKSERGATAASINAEIAKFHELTAAAKAYEQTRLDGETALKDLTDDRALIEDKVRSGQLFQIQATEQIEALESKRVANLQKIATAQLAAAHTPEQLAAARDFQRVVDGIKIEANATLADVARIKAGVESGLVGSFENFFDTGIIGARNLGQAFAGLADGIVGSLRKIAAQMLATKLTEKLLNSIPGLAPKKDAGAGGAAQEIATATAKGVAQAAPLTAAAGALGTAGAAVVTGGTAVGTASAGLGTAAVTLGTSAVALGTAAAALGVSAAALAAANNSGDGGGGGGGGGGGVSGFLGMLGAFGGAAGGLVTGPGTETSDSIPAQLSTGEFVFRAAAVRAIGPEVLAAMNRGLRTPAIADLRSTVPRFAEGGLVQGTGAGAPAQHQLVVGLEEGIVLKHMSSRAAGKITVQHLANNPKQASKAIGRGR